MFNFKTLTTPIIQAPMAGGICTPALAAAVANKGGVGGFGFAYSTPAKIADDLSRTRLLTHGPINANFFIFNPVARPNAQLEQNAIAALNSLPVASQALTTPLTLPSAPYYPNLTDQIEPVWQQRPDILTFHFGIPEATIVEKAHALGIAVGMTATCLTEAIAIKAAGADFIVAQGIEAGGHRGVFEVDADDEQLSTIDLTRQLAEHGLGPIVSAGGIMNGTDIQRALDAGATATQLGTAFLCCDESGASEAHKHFLRHEVARGSMLTRAFSGRPARGINNAFMAHMQDKALLPFPLQNTLTGSMRKWAAQTNNGEYQSLWAGTEYHRARAMPAADLMTTLLEEMTAAK